jgi:hypothetical protein
MRAVIGSVTPIPWRIELHLQQRARRAPVARDGTLGEAEQSGDFAEAEAGEEMQLDDLGEARIRGGELLQGLVESNHVDLVARIRTLAPDTLVGVGLGISNGDQAARVVEFADAAIVGSAFVKPMLAADDAGTPGDLAAVRSLLADLAAGVRR